MADSNIQVIPVDHDPWGADSLGAKLYHAVVDPWTQPLGDYQGKVLPFSASKSGARFDSSAGLLGSLKSGATLPHDVAQGLVDPNSPEGMARVQNLAGLLSGGPLAGTGEGAVASVGWHQPWKFTPKMKEVMSSDPTVSWAISPDATVQGHPLSWTAGMAPKDLLKKDWITNSGFEQYNTPIDTAGVVAAAFKGDQKAAAEYLHEHPGEWPHDAEAIKLLENGYASNSPMPIPLQSKHGELISNAASYLQEAYPNGYPSWSDAANQVGKEMHIWAHDPNATGEFTGLSPAVKNAVKEQKFDLGGWEPEQELDLGDWKPEPELSPKDLLNSDEYDTFPVSWAPVDTASAVTKAFGGDKKAAYDFIMNGGALGTKFENLPVDHLYDAAQEIKAGIGAGPKPSPASSFVGPKPSLTSASTKSTSPFGPFTPEPPTIYRPFINRLPNVDPHLQPVNWLEQKSPFFEAQGSDWENLSPYLFGRTVPSEEALQRAAGLGFNPNLPLFKGLGGEKERLAYERGQFTNPLLKPEGGERGIFFSDEPKIAQSYGNSRSFLARPLNPVELDWGGFFGDPNYGSRMGRVLESAWGKGADAVILRNIKDQGSYLPQTQYVFRDPAALRYTSAEFDPAWEPSAQLARIGSLPITLLPVDHDPWSQTSDQNQTK